MKNLILVLFIALSVVGCKEKKDPDRDDRDLPQPTRETTTPTETYDPEGTRLRTRCEGTTKVIFYADGSGGEYREEYPRDEACGWPNVTIEGTGTYFRPVVVTVEDIYDGMPYDIDLGNVKETPTGFEITSDGRTGTGVLQIAGKTWFYEIEPEPICQNTDSGYSKYRLDCNGYYMSDGVRPYEGLIYYGEEDETIVPIETSLAIYTADTSVWGPIDPSDPVYQEAIEAFENHTEWFQSQGIWIDLKLVHVEYGEIARSDGVDIMVEAGGEIDCGDQPGCIGSAYQGRDFTVGLSRPRLTEVINFQGGIVRHEIGHIFGLGHGILADEDWNLFTNHNLNYSLGTFFPTFGHGWYADKGVCANQGTFMTYQSSGVASNELFLCKDLYPNRDPRFWYSAWGEYAGNREMGSDEAYAMNRVRYNVSLIHNEHSVVEASPLLGPIQYEVEEVLIVEPAEG